MFSGQAPRALEAVFEHVATAAQSGTYSVGHLWPKFSEEWYWERLVDKKPFRSVYEEESGRQPLISKRSRNLSQTPREQCELEGLVREGLEREGPGQVSGQVEIARGGRLRSTFTCEQELSICTYTQPPYCLMTDSCSTRVWPRLPQGGRVVAAARVALALHWRCIGVELLPLQAVGLHGLNCLKSCPRHA